MGRSQVESKRSKLVQLIVQIFHTVNCRKVVQMKLSVFGLGLGAPMLAVFANKGYQVIGFDVSENRLMTSIIIQPIYKKRGYTSCSLIVEIFTELRLMLMMPYLTQTFLSLLCLPHLERITFSLMITLSTYRKIAFLEVEGRLIRS